MLISSKLVIRREAGSALMMKGVGAAAILVYHSCLFFMHRATKDAAIYWSSLYMPTIVNSWNEWDPLKHVIVGRADDCHIPARGTGA